MFFFFVLGLSSNILFLFLFADFFLASRDLSALPQVSKVDQECQTDEIPLETRSRQFTEDTSVAIHELEKQPDNSSANTTPSASCVMEGVALPAVAVNPMSDGGVSKTELENILGLFKAFSVLSHSYLYMRLCMCLEHDKQPPISAIDLKELAQLAQLVLEMPIPDTSIMLRQEKPGSAHLQLFLSDSTMHPLVC